MPMYIYSAQAEIDCANANAHIIEKERVNKSLLFDDSLDCKETFSQVCRAILKTFSMVKRSSICINVSSKKNWKTFHYSSTVLLVFASSGILM